MKILLVHSLWGTSENMSNIEEFLNKKFQVINIDLGKKSSINDYIQIVENKVNKLNEEVFIIGHSMGGLIAQKLAEKMKNIKGIVMINSSLPRGIFPHWKVSLRFSKYFLKMIFGTKFVPNIKDSMEVMFNKRTSYFHRLFMERGSILRDISFGKISVSKIGCPSLVISSRHDKMSPTSVQKKLAKKYNSELFVCDGNHMAPIYEADALIMSEKIKNWIIKHL